MLVKLHQRKFFGMRLTFYLMKNARPLRYCCSVVFGVKILLLFIWPMGRELVARDRRKGGVDS